MTIALWCLFIAGLLHVVSKFPLSNVGRVGAGLQSADVDDWRLRWQAARQSQLESFPLFAAGVLVASSFAGRQPLVDILAIAYVLARLAYLFFVVLGIISLRSVVWVVGCAASLALLCSPAWAHWQPLF